jgi:hypothetical protein
MGLKFVWSASFYFALVLSLPVTVLAADAEGCKDSPVIARVPGSTLSKCGHQEAGQAAVSVRKGKEIVDQTLEGDYQSWGYVTRDRITDSEVFHVIEEALKQAGFQIDNESDPERITAHKGNLWYGLENRGDYYKQIVVTVKAK